MGIPLDTPTTSVPRLISELVAAIRAVGIPGGKASVACTEVLYLKTLLPTAAGMSLASASDQLVPTISIRILIPPVGSSHTGVGKEFQDAIKSFGSMLTEELNEFVQRSEVRSALQDRGIGKVLVECKQHSTHGRENVERSETVLNWSEPSADQQPRKKIRKAVA